MGLCLEALNSLMYDEALTTVSSISSSVQSLEKGKSLKKTLHIRMHMNTNEAKQI